MTIDIKILEQLDKATNSEVYDLEYGDFVYPTVETRDTLEDFRNNSDAWAERGKFFYGSLDNFGYIGWDSAQPRKGDQRDPITIIDLGEIRIAIRHDVRDLI